MRSDGTTNTAPLRVRRGILREGWSDAITETSLELDLGSACTRA
jgi:hypothetical protein